MCVCVWYSDDDTVTSIRFRWLRSSVEVAMSSGVSQIDLNLQSVSVNDSGTYVCEATLLSASNGVISTLRSIPEVLTVISKL